MLRAVGLSTFGSSSSKDPNPTSPSADGDLSLARTISGASMLSPPNPAFSFGSPSGGILLNAHRPNSRPNSRPTSRSRSAASHERGLDSPRSDGLASTPMRPDDDLEFPFDEDAASSSQRGRPESRSGPPSREGVSGQRDASAVSGSLQSANRKIRFAPLPAPRPRSYSADRDGYNDDGDDAGGDWSSGLNRRDSAYGDDDGDGPDGSSFPDGDAIEFEEDDDSKGVFGSWKLGGGWGKGKKRASISGPAAADSPQSSRRGSIESISAASKASSNLSRTTSIEQPHTIVKSGVPMRKAQTWDSSDSSSSKSSKFRWGSLSSKSSDKPQYAPQRKVAYPSVAQRSKTKKPAPVQVEEPAFEEWGGGGLGARQRRNTEANVPAAAAKRDEDEDDGSGMAWLKKRRREREAEEAEKKRKEAEEAEEAARKAAEGPEEQEEEALSPSVADEKELSASSADDDSDNEHASAASEETSASSVIASPRLDAAPLPTLSPNPNEDIGPKGEGRATPPITGTPRLGSFSSLPPSAKSGLAQQLEKTPVGNSFSVPGERAPPKRQDSLASSIASTVGPGPASKITRLGANSYAIQLKNDEDDEDSDDESDEEDEEDAPSSTPKGPKAPKEKKAAPEAQDDDDDDDDDDDLDEEELRREEELCEQARVTAKGAGAEKYHDHRHQSLLIRTEKAGNSGTASPSGISTPAMSGAMSSAENLARSRAASSASKIQKQ